MCYHIKLEKDSDQLELEFDKKIVQVDLFEPSEHYNGFAKPLTPIIANNDQDVINMAQWGFQASWQPAALLNAKIETLDTLKSFKDFEKNRCLVIVDGFFEWKHLDPKGKEKEKYQIGFDDKLFCLAGIYKIENNTQYYTIVTTEAQGIMREIHNTKLRMPFALNSHAKMNAWLHEEPVEPDWDFTAQKKAIRNNP